MRHFHFAFALFLSFSANASTDLYITAKGTSFCPGRNPEKELQSFTIDNVNSVYPDVQSNPTVFTAPWKSKPTAYVTFSSQKDGKRNISMLIEDAGSFDPVTGTYTRYGYSAVLTGTAKLGTSEILYMKGDYVMHNKDTGCSMVGTFKATGPSS